MVQRRYTFDVCGGEKKDSVYHNPSGSRDSGWISAIEGYTKLLLMVFAAVAVLTFRNEVATRIFVSGNSMNPTYKSGDVLFLWELSFEVKRYDVVVADVDGMAYVKRVIGLPGDRVEIANGTVYINGERIDAEYDFVTETDGTAETYVVGEGSYFLLGDNRGDSRDSRDFGCVDGRDIKGVVAFTVFPPSSR